MPSITRNLDQVLWWRGKHPYYKRVDWMSLWLVIQS